MLFILSEKFLCKLVIEYQKRKVSLGICLRRMETLDNDSLIKIHMEQPTKGERNYET